VTFVPNARACWPLPKGGQVTVRRGSMLRGLRGIVKAFFLRIAGGEVVVENGPKLSTSLKMWARSAAARMSSGRTRAVCSSHTESARTGYLLLRDRASGSTLNAEMPQIPRDSNSGRVYGPWTNCRAAGNVAAQALCTLHIL
jgi:hypothetical protein